jgi:tocopherol cyclase
MSSFIERTLHPEGYHGRGQAPPFFEGWYFKIVDATETHRYAVIPGISLGEGEGGPHSFVQVLDGVTGQTLYHRYPVEAFSANETTLDVQVGPNHFTADRMELDLTGTLLPLRGTVTFHGAKPWPVTLPAPGIMGPFAWIPRMECYHGVLSLDHGLSGSLETEEGTIAFDGGRGYIEKDWGQAFPSGWVWMQSNHFGQPGAANTGTSITASIAMIPWIGHSFPGFIVGLLWQGSLYRFATYTGAVTRHLAVTDQTVTWVIEDPVYRLALTGHRAESGHLRGPSKEDMGRRVPETLSARVDVVLVARREGRTLFSGTGLYAGMEIGGDIHPLLTGDGCPP